MASLIRIGGRELLPQFRVNLSLTRALDAQEIEELTGLIRNGVRGVFADYFPKLATPAEMELSGTEGLDYDLEIEVSVGSLRVRILIGAASMAIALSSCASPRAVGTKQHLQEVASPLPPGSVEKAKLPRIETELRRFFETARKQTRDIVGSGLVASEETPERRLGAIVRLDAVLRQFELRRLSRAECVKELVAVLAKIRVAGNYRELVSALVRYIDTRYELFDWDSFAETVSRIGQGTTATSQTFVPVLRLHIEIVPVSVRNESRPFEEEAVRKLIREEVENACRSQNCGHSDVNVQVESKTGTILATVLWGLGGAIAFFIGYGKLRTGIDRFKEDVKNVGHAAANRLREHGWMVQEPEPVTTGAFPRLQCFLATHCEQALTKEQVLQKWRAMRSGTHSERWLMSTCDFVLTATLAGSERLIA